MSKKPKSGEPTPSADKLTHSPFAALAQRALQVAPSVPQSPAPAPAPGPSAPSGKSRGRLVLRRETKHRGGKAVVVVSGLELLHHLNDHAVDALAKQLKQTLGCGGTVEREQGKTQIVLQGDRAAQVAEALRAQGFRVEGVTR